MSYNPDPGATPTGIQFTRQLVSHISCESVLGQTDTLAQSQRDLSLQIPLNFVTAPGVVLTQ